jgi:hypothetical protein
MNFIMKKRNIFYTVLLICIVAINLFFFKDSNQISSFASLLSMNTAHADTEAGGALYIPITTTETTSGSMYTKTDGCTSGKHKNCAKVTTITTTTCLSGGNSNCTAGAVPITTESCSECTY